MITEFLTGVLVIITAIYAYLTHRMVKASEGSLEAVRSQSEAMLRPYLSVAPWIRPHALFLYLRVTNSGRTAAENVRFTIDRDFFQWGDTTRPDSNLRAQNAFSLPIDSLAPGTELLFALGQGWLIFGKDAKSEVPPLQFNVTASYEFFGKSVQEVNRIDLRLTLARQVNLTQFSRSLNASEKFLRRND